MQVHFLFSSTTSISFPWKERRFLQTQSPAAALGPWGLYRSKALQTSLLTGLPPPLYPSPQASTHHRNSLIAIPPCSTWICLWDFEKRNLKGLKLKLRNKQQLAINKFPKVWEFVLCTHSTFQGQLHSLTNRLATARLRELHQAEEKHK